MKRTIKWIAIAAGVLLIIGGIGAFIFYRNMQNMMGKDVILSINVMNHLSIDCDCDGNPAEPDIHDIGILASADPVALDQACVDLIYQAEGREALVSRMEERNAEHVLEHGEEIGLGNRSYQLVRYDVKEF